VKCGDGGQSDHNQLDGLSSPVGGSARHTRWPILRQLVRVSSSPSLLTGAAGTTASCRDPGALLGYQQEIDETLFHPRTSRDYPVLLSRSLGRILVT